MSFQIMSDRFSGPISLETYDKSKIFRVPQDDIEPRVLYVAMFRLRPHQKYEAVKLPLMTGEILATKRMGELAIKVAFYDLDLKNIVGARATLVDGYWQDPYKAGAILTDINLSGYDDKLDIVEGYLRTNNRSREDKARDIGRFSIPDNQLVSA
jgi:hypothetical protein